VEFNTDPRSCTPALGLVSPFVPVTVTDGGDNNNFNLVAKRVTGAIIVQVRNANNNAPVSGIEASADITSGGTNYSTGNAGTDNSGNVTQRVFNGQWSVTLNTMDLNNAGYEGILSQNVTISNNTNSVTFLVQPIAPVPPLHHYSFVNGTVIDRVGSANGTLMNGAVSSNGFLTLDGVNDYVQFNQKIIPTLGNFSVLFYAQQTVSQAGQYAEIISQGSSGAGFYIGHDTSHNMRIGGCLPSPGVSFFGDGQIHHYALSADASDARLYFDGLLVSSKGSALSMTSSGTDTRLGRQFDPFTEYFHGNIADLWVFSGALSQSQIGAVILATPPIIVSPTHPGNNQFRFTVVALPNQTYTVQYSANLSTWTPLVTTNSPVNSFTVTDTAATNSERYYRVLVGQ